MGYRNYANTAGFIVAKDGNGDFATIAAALAAATSGTTIFIRPGTYTENLTLVAGVDLVAFTADASEPNVTIVGKATFTAAGTTSISGVRLTTNSDFLLAVTGSAASIVNLTNCYLNCSNNTGISFTSSSGSAQVNVYNCFGNLGTTGIGLYSSSSAGSLNLEYTEITNSGVSTTASTNSSGPVGMDYVKLNSPLSCSSTGTIALLWTIVACTALNTTTVTLAGTGASSAQFSNFGGGTASAISVGAGTTLSMENCICTSSNTNSITGAGTINYSSIVFPNSNSNIINTTTQVSEFVALGKYKAAGQPAFNAFRSSDATNVTGDGTTYTIVWNSVASPGFDQASNFNTGSGTFTAPVAGKYLMNVVIEANGLTGADTSFVAALVTTLQTYNVANETITNTISGNAIIRTWSGIVSMASGDTATVTLTVAGSTKTANVTGAAGRSTWSGCLIA